MSEEMIPPHLKVSETVTDHEFTTAKWQSRVVLLVALGVGILAAFVLVIYWGAMRGLAVGGLIGIGCERLMDRILPEVKKMRTQRMKVYPQLREYRKRQDGGR